MSAARARSIQTVLRPFHLRPAPPTNQIAASRLAYCVALGLPSGLLIYIGERPLHSYSIRRAGIDLEVLSVKVTDRPRDLEARVRAAAQLFIGRAAEHHSQCV